MDEVKLPLGVMPAVTYWDDPPPAALLIAALRWTWNGVYLIVECPDGRLLITRADGQDSFHVPDPLEARDAIIGDFYRSPVTRPQEAGALRRRAEFEEAHPAVTWIAPSSRHRCTWEDADGPEEETAPTVDAMLKLLRIRGFKW